MAFAVTDTPVASSELTSSAETPYEVQDISHARSNDSVTTSGSSSSSNSSRRSSCRSTSSYTMPTPSHHHRHRSSSPDSSPSQSFLERTDDVKASHPPIDTGDTNKELTIDEEIDWEFWSRVISDYEQVVKLEPEQLAQHVHRGVPTQLRGMIWQLFAKSKDERLEEDFMCLLNKETAYKKAIDRDLERCQDLSDEHRERLFNVLKAYSLYNEDIGYRKELLPVTRALVINMPEEEAFCVLVRLMTHYDLQGHFIKSSTLLRRRLYHCDAVLQDRLCHIYKYLDERSIHAEDYASQWYTDLFSHLLPLCLIQRVLDVVLADGMFAVHRLAVRAMEANQAEILSLDKNHVLSFLQKDMWQVRQDQISNWIVDMRSIKIEEKRLEQLAKQYAKSDTNEVDKLRQENRTLGEQVGKLKAQFESLHHEHAQVVEQLASTKLAIAQTNDDNETLRQQSQDLKKELDTLPTKIEERTKGELEILSTKNDALVKRNLALEEQLKYMESMVAEMQSKYAASEKERNELRLKVAELKNLMA